MAVQQTVRPRLIEGYAAVFGVEDASGDIVRAGAFSRSLRRSNILPMLLQHRSGAVAGRWVRVREDGRGLYARGLIENQSALALAVSGLDGLSIGFRPVMWHRLPGGGRELTDVELVEISLVSDPMQRAARFSTLIA
ncbi:MAG: HK97 family phage prohead protease [Pseudomonadota bacterium]